MISLSAVGKKVSDAKQKSFYKNSLAQPVKPAYDKIKKSK